MSELVSFSVIIPTYNRAQLVTKTISSLLEQTNTNFEIIVVDDGSTDDTADVIRSINDDRLKYFSKQNGERGAARNFGVSKASRTYINYFDSDDLAYPHHLQTAAELISRNNFPEMVHLGYEYRTDEGKLLGSVNRFDGNVTEYAIKKKMVAVMSMFIRKDIAEQFPFSENREFVLGEDALHLCQLAARYPLYYDNTITSTVIQHNNRTMTSSDETHFLYCKEQLLQELKKDGVFMNKHARYLPEIGNEYNYLLWKKCIDSGNNKKAWQYFKSYVKTGYKNIFSKRTLVFFKGYIFNLFK